jgi:hypothetical protein
MSQYVYFWKKRSLRESSNGKRTADAQELKTHSERGVTKQQYLSCGQGKLTVLKYILYDML